MPLEKEKDNFYDFGMAPEPFDNGYTTREPSKWEIEQFIRDVFGDHVGTAFRLLECENSTLDPYAVNTDGNFPEGSQDIGVFQINEYWQGVNPKFLRNWRLNIIIAKQLYDENGHQFNLWTCGKSMDI